MPRLQKIVRIVEIHYSSSGTIVDISQILVAKKLNITKGKP